MPEQMDPETELVERTSEAFLGEWNHLVSTTNWEKGRIIQQWRQALIAAEANPQTWSDEIWSRRVGNVSSQHVGRLRRVHERFSEVRSQYAGLYWSHFQAALDWDDAEMWLEGAVQNRWSISQMRTKRSETLGLLEGDAGFEDESYTQELDEDYVSVGEPPAAVDIPWEIVRDPADALDEDRAARDSSSGESVKRHERSPEDSKYQPETDEERDTITSEPVRPFAHLRPLDGEIGEAFEAFKLAILRQKISGWRDVSRDDVLANLDALRALALAPSND